MVLDFVNLDIYDQSEAIQSEVIIHFDICNNLCFSPNNNRFNL